MTGLQLLLLALLGLASTAHSDQQVDVHAIEVGAELSTRCCNGESWANERPSRCGISFCFGKLQRRLFIPFAKGGHTREVRQAESGQWPAGITVPPTPGKMFGTSANSCRAPLYCNARPSTYDPFGCEDWSDCCDSRVTRGKCGAGSTCNVGCRPGCAHTYNSVLH
jgi:hypothetical protein